MKEMIYIGRLSKKVGLGSLKGAYAKKEGMLFLRGVGEGAGLITQCILSCYIFNFYIKINFMQK